MNPVLDIKQLQYSWGSIASSLSVRQLQLLKGQSLFLQGPSGSGKSTLLNLIGGVIKPQQGDITLLGQTYAELSKSKLDQLRADHIGFIFQQFNLLPYLDLIDNVVLPCRFSERRKNRALSHFSSLQQGAEELLIELGIDRDLHGRNVLQLSTGQQQRVAVARALLGAPELIVADEPSSALDTEHRDRFIELLLAQSQSHQCSVIFVSHDPGLAQFFDFTLALQAKSGGGFQL